MPQPCYGCLKIYPAKPPGCDSKYNLSFCYSHSPEKSTLYFHTEEEMASKLSPTESIALIKANLAEVLNPEIIDNVILNEKRPLKVYWGTAPTVSNVFDKRSCTYGYRGNFGSSRHVYRRHAFPGKIELLKLHLDSHNSQNTGTDSEICRVALIVDILCQ